MMMGLNGLFRENLIEWITAMTYQAASGGRGANMRELLTQSGAMHQSVANLLADPHSAILEIDERVTASMRSSEFPCDQFQVPLAGSLIPWIDRDLENGMSREEWKGDTECNKILGTIGDHPQAVRVESLCIRIGAMRCHSQASHHLFAPRPSSEGDRGDYRVRERMGRIRGPNTKEASIQKLTPTAS